ncbi:MAG: LmbE family N-acetylglucosaminyl deacetylase [Patiriisocius sp.]|jgi:LmbE family N-acetylglucosaminyl deacetylase
MKKVIVLAPHTDDGEFGCGGTICKLIQSGATVYYVAFSSCEKSLPDGMDPNTLKYELMNATNVLGIDPKNVILYDFPVRDFPQYRQDILEKMTVLAKDIQPDLVFAPSLNDIHQDHNTIALEAMRAFKKTSILGYELPWNNFVFRNQVFFQLDKEFVEKKIKALACYISQKERPYANIEYITGISRGHGIKIGVEYAEVFETSRMIIK